MEDPALDVGAEPVCMCVSGFWRYGMKERTLCSASAGVMFAHYSHGQYVISRRRRRGSLTHWLNPSLYPNGKYPVKREVPFAADGAFACSFARCEASMGC
jgi:hypothetical protein